MNEQEHYHIATSAADYLAALRAVDECQRAMLHAAHTGNSRAEAQHTRELLGAVAKRDRTLRELRAMVEWH